MHNILKSIMVVSIVFTFGASNAQAQVASAVIPISSCEELQKIGSNSPSSIAGQNMTLSASYVLTKDIDCSATSTPSWKQGKGFVPIGGSALPTDNNKFKGKFDGQGYQIKNLTFNFGDTAQADPASHSIGFGTPVSGAIWVYLGLFGSTAAGSEITNLKLTNVNITGGHVVGAVVGVAYGNINNVSVLSGNLKPYDLNKAMGITNVGGLAGTNYGKIIDSNTNVSISGSMSSGGLVASNANVGEISGCSTAGTLRDSIYSAGLVASNDGKIQKSYSSATIVVPDKYAGAGLVGINKGTIDQSFSYGNVQYLGTTSSVLYLGGLVSNNVNGGTVTSSYWDTDTSKLKVSSGGVGKTTAEMKSKSTYANWANFDSTWTIREGQDYPRLKWETPPTVQITNCQQLQRVQGDFAGSYVLANDIDCSQESNSYEIANIFSGTFDGQGHKIKMSNIGAGVFYPSGALVHTALANSYGGFFGYLLNATVKNLTIEVNQSRAVYYGGILAGRARNTTIDNVHVKGSVAPAAPSTPRVFENIYARGLFGGLVGLMDSGSIVNSDADVVFTGESQHSTFGGLVGLAGARDVVVTITNSSAKVNANQANILGGLVGLNVATISGSYSSGTLNAGKNSNPTNSIYLATCMGGIVGENYNEINNSYSTASLKTADQVGGLVGFSGNNAVGGTRSIARNSFFAGTIDKVNNGGSSLGGINGFVEAPNTNPTVNSFWNSDLLAGIVPANPSESRTTLQMKQQDTFAGFNFTPVTGKWKIFEGLDYPHLAWEIYPKTMPIVAPDGREIISIGIDNNVLAYYSPLPGVPHNFEMFYYNLSTGITRHVFNSLTNISHSFVISGARVVSLAEMTGFKYRASVQELFNNSSNDRKQNISNDVTYPDIDGDRVVYGDGSLRDIYLFNLNSNTERTITSGPMRKFRPKLAGNYVVYSKDPGGEAHVPASIYAYDLLSNQEFLLGVGDFLDTDGEKAVYSRFDGSTKVCFYDLKAKQEVVIRSLPPVDGASVSLNSLNISKDWVVWADTRKNNRAGVRFSIYGYHLPSQQEFLLVNNTGGQFSSLNISNNRLVWVEDKDGKKRAFVMDLNFNRQTVKFKMNVTGNGGGTVTSHPFGLNCFATGGVEADKACEMTLDKGTSMKLYSKPASGSRAITLDISKLNAAGVASVDQNTGSNPFVLNSDAEIGQGFNPITKPDLKVKILSVTPNQVYSGLDSLVIQVSVTNESPIIAKPNKLTLILANGLNNYNHEINVPEIIGGGSWQSGAINFAIPVGAAGNFAIGAKIDSANQIDEGVDGGEDNNINPWQYNIDVKLGKKSYPLIGAGFVNYSDDILTSNKLCDVQSQGLFPFASTMQSSIRPTRSVSYFAWLYVLTGYRTERYGAFGHKKRSVPVYRLQWQRTNSIPNQTRILDKTLVCQVRL